MVKSEYFNSILGKTLDKPLNSYIHLSNTDFMLNYWVNNEYNLLMWD